MTSVPILELYKYAGIVSRLFPNMQFSGIREIYEDDSNFLTYELVETHDSSLFIKVPRTHEAITMLEAQIRVTKVLHDDVNVKFALPKFKVVESFVNSLNQKVKLAVLDPYWGTPVDLRDLDSAQVKSLAYIIGQIHTIKASAVETIGVPSFNNVQIRDRMRQNLGRVSHTGKVPSTLIESWDNFINNDKNWKFASTVIHGSLSPADILFQGDVITFVNGWTATKIDDPAVDLAGITPGLNAKNNKLFYHEYKKVIQNHNSSCDKNIEERAEFYSQFEYADNFLLAIDHKDAELEAEMLECLRELNKKIIVKAQLEEALDQKVKDQLREKERKRMRQLQNGMPTMILDKDEIKKGVETLSNEQIPKIKKQFLNQNSSGMSFASGGYANNELANRDFMQKNPAKEKISLSKYVDNTPLDNNSEEDSSEAKNEEFDFDKVASDILDDNDSTSEDGSDNMTVSDEIPDILDD